MALLDGAVVGSKWILRNDKVATLVDCDNHTAPYEDRRYVFHCAETSSKLYRFPNGKCCAEGRVGNDFDPVQLSVSIQQI